MIKLQNMEWKEDAAELSERLGAMAGHQDRPMSERSICWGASLLLIALREELDARIGTAPEGAAPASSKPPTDTTGHRHSYDETGRCKLPKADGTGRCEVVSRASKKAAPPAPAAGGSAP